MLPNNIKLFKLHQRYKISLNNPIISFKTIEPIEPIEKFNKQYPESNILGQNY